MNTLKIPVTAAMVAAARDELDPRKPGPHMLQVKRAISAALELAAETQTPTDDEICQALEEMGRIRADPMWALHCEVSKTALARWTKALRGAYYKGYAEAGYDANEQPPVAMTPDRTRCELDEPRLDKPAQVSNTRFGVNVKWATVIGAAQRYHEYMATPEKEAERIASGHKFLAELQSAATAVAGAAHAGAINDPLSGFQEGQWWVNELDAWAKTGSDDQKRAVATVHHMLRSAAAPTPIADSGAMTGERAANLGYGLALAEDRLRRISFLIANGHSFIDKGRTIEIWADQARATLAAAAAAQPVSVDAVPVATKGFSGCSECTDEPECAWHQCCIRKQCAAQAPVALTGTQIERARAVADQKHPLGPCNPNWYRAFVAEIIAAPAQPAVAPVAVDSIRQLIGRHAEQLKQNEYAYFELAYTRHTGWMAWLCSNSREDDPNRKVLAKGQGDSAEAACEAALAASAPAAPLTARAIESLNVSPFGNCGAVRRASGAAWKPHPSHSMRESLTGVRPFTNACTRCGAQMAGTPESRDHDCRLDEPCAPAAPQEAT